MSGLIACLLAAVLPLTAAIGVRAEDRLEAPVAPVPPLFDQAAIDNALSALDSIVEDVMAQTGLPGMAVGVVYKDKAVYAKSFGIRGVGEVATVDPATVFLLASVSKPIASTIVARLVQEGIVAWEDPAHEHDPSFALSDPYVTEHATLTDLLSHRSGLRTGAGDLLEDLGFDRETILARLDQQPLDPFRSTYHYSNFGYTSGAVAAAMAAGQTWEDLADETLFERAGMATASYRHADYLSRNNRARIHQRLADGSWAALYDRDADAQAPAGGASASLNDMLRFLRLQLGNGALEGVQIVQSDALQATHVTQVISRAPAVPAARGSFYGLGWDVSYDDQGRARISHSGAFELGAATSITFLPGEDLGFVVLTNGEPIGAAEAVGAAFLDVAQNGRQTVDWLGFLGGIFAQMKAADAPVADYARAPPDPRAAAPLAAYAGTYRNDYYGPLVVVQSDDGLAMTLGPGSAPKTFALRHYDGDTFSFETIGENANGLAGAIFTMDPAGEASRVTLDFYDRNGLGTFVRQ